MTDKGELQGERRSDACNEIAHLTRRRTPDRTVSHPWLKSEAVPLSLISVHLVSVSADIPDGLRPGGARRGTGPESARLSDRRTVFQP